MAKNLRGGRSPWLQADTYQNQQSDYERRTQADLLLRAIDVPKDVTPRGGYVIITDSSTTSVTLPREYESPVVIKNATGATMTINAPANTTIYADTSGYTSVSALDGDSISFVKNGSVWYVVG